LDLAAAWADGSRESHLVALFKVKPDKHEEAVEALSACIEATHDEAGCLNYALHHSKGDPDTYVLVERWTSQVALENHMQQPYVAALGAKAGDLIAEPPVIHFSEPIPVGDPVKGVL